MFNIQGSICERIFENKFFEDIVIMPEYSISSVCVTGRSPVTEGDKRSPPPEHQTEYPGAPAAQLEPRMSEEEAVPGRESCMCFLSAL